MMVAADCEICLQLYLIKADGRGLSVHCSDPAEHWIA